VESLFSKNSRGKKGGERSGGSFEKRGEGFVAAEEGLPVAG